MASRHVAALPRGKSSGQPFHSRFTDIAQQAGLRHAAIEGHASRADYVVEAMGSGVCVSWITITMDGWTSWYSPAHASATLHLMRRPGFIKIIEMALSPM